MKQLKKTKITLVFVLCVSIIVNTYGAKIYLIGDSTVSTYNSSYFPQAGWGQMLQYFLNSDSIIVVNKAIGGRSSKSFYNDHWSYIRDVLEPGDYVFVQFGINDANSSDTSRYAAPWTDFKDYLTKFVNETQAKGATCVLVATLRRNAWNDTDPPTMYDAYHDYPVVTRTLASELNVPLIDLDAACKNLMEPFGPSYVGPFMYMNLDPGEYPIYPGGQNDNVHFQEMGAIEMARLVIEEMEGLGDFPEMAKLIPYINPMYEVAVTSNMPDEGIITRTASYPKNLYVTVKAKPETGYDLKKWQDAQGNLISTEKIFRFKMDSSALAYKAFFTEHHDTITIQEDETGFCGVDGSVDDSYSGFTGSGYAATVDSARAGIDWQIDVGMAGSYTFEWRYANGLGNQSAILMVNSDTAISNISFAGSGAWTSWDTTSVNVNLEAKMQKVRLEATSDNGLPNIDLLKIRGSIVEPAECGSNNVTSGEVYRIIDKASNKALEVADASTTDGANVQQGTYTGANYQQWKVVKNESGYYSIIAKHSGKFLDVSGKSVNDGGNAIQWYDNGGFNQQWTITYTDSIWFKIIARHSGKCLEVANGSAVEGANVQQWTDNGTASQRWQFVLASEPISSVKQNTSAMPVEFALEQNYPNPFNPQTEIRYHLAKTAKIQLAIYDILGHKIKTLVDNNLQAGPYTIHWDGKNARGRSVAGGIYFYRLYVETSDQVFTKTRKMVLIK